jgi:hypothetical protein
MGSEEARAFAQRIPDRAQEADYFPTQSHRKESPMSEGPQRTLDLYPIDYPFETLVSRITAMDPKLILNPEFQRKYKWDKEGWGRASKFIESCLMRIPLPPCYSRKMSKGDI